MLAHIPRRVTSFAALLLVASSLGQAQTPSQVPSAVQLAQERAQAETEAPKLFELLQLVESSTVADVGAGGGALSVVLARLVPRGKVLATDINLMSLAEIRDYAERERLTNLFTIHGSVSSTSLEASCCDAIVMRNVYHHLIEPERFVASVIDSLKPGGQLAVIDFPARAGTQLPVGVRNNRGGNGIEQSLVEEEIGASALERVRTIERWPAATPTSRAYLSLFRKRR